MQEAITAVREFLLSEGSGGGFIGAFLILAASYFRDVGLQLKGEPFRLQVLFLLAGTLAGALFTESGMPA